MEISVESLNMLLSAGGAASASALAVWSAMTLQIKAKNKIQDDEIKSIKDRLGFIEKEFTSIEANSVSERDLEKKMSSLKSEIGSKIDHLTERIGELNSTIINLLMKR